MPLLVRTSRVSYSGLDRLDITHKSARGIGRAFAPSWRILEPALRARRNADGLRGAGKDAAAERLEGAAWERYSEAYRAEMRQSYEAQRPAWTTLLARPSATLVCYCTDPKRCHRTLLAGYLERLGAKVVGEVG